jgi:hypothetical protein
MRLQKLKMQPQKSEHRIQKTEESRSYMQQITAAYRCMDFLHWRLAFCLRRVLGRIMVRPLRIEYPEVVDKLMAGGTPEVRYPWVMPIEAWIDTS